MTVTAIRTYIPEHFASCTEAAIGRRVMHWARTNPEAVADLGSLAVANDHYRGECSCFAMQLTRVEADLTVARKAHKAGYDKGAVIADLTVRRDALKSVTTKIDGKAATGR